MKVLTIISVMILFSLFPLAAGGKSEEPQAGENTMMMVSETPAMEREGTPFIEYQNAEQAMMLAGEKPTVLFFNASWCPDCRAAREDFIENSDRLTGVNLVIVDYDNSDELQATYGVTYQHTFVQIDETGKALTSWNGGATEQLLESIVREEM